mmetsp:Transcript_11255/g.34837  ORF Transcript_11255/g.34837 Transcript_11255/m.34837 type:complete len:125 (-) Transcript_11255:4-378(-)
MYRLWMAAFLVCAVSTCAQGRSNGTALEVPPPNVTTAAGMPVAAAAPPANDSEAVEVDAALAAGGPLECVACRRVARDVVAGGSLVHCAAKCSLYPVGGGNILCNLLCNSLVAGAFRPPLGGCA